MVPRRTNVEKRQITKNMIASSNDLFEIALIIPNEIYAFLNYLLNNDHMIRLIVIFAIISKEQLRRITST